MNDFGFMHRGIDPSNISIDKEFNIIFNNFNSAREIPNDQKGRALSPHVQKRGYRSPEIALTENYN